MDEFSDIIRLFACVSLIIGAVECFAGFKIMKAMLSLWGFFTGAMLGVIVGVATGNTIFGVVLIVVLGVALAVLAFKLYLAGIFILTAFLTAVASYIISGNIFAALFFAVVVGTLAMCFVKPVVILTTAISGSGIIVSSAYLIMNLKMNGNSVATAILWLPITAAGIAVQYITTQKTRGARSRHKDSLKSSDSSVTFSERRYPGMQRAYRNFCIKCGCELFGTASKCPRCGYIYDD